MLEIEDFVYPKAVSGRSVDGIFLVGSVITPEIVKQFEEINIPCLCFSHCEINSKTVIRVHRDPSWLKTLFKLCLDNGHTKVGVSELDCHGSCARRKNMKAWLDEQEMEYISMPIQANNANDISNEIISQYFSMHKAERPSVISSTPDACMAMIDKFSQQGISCPDDLSLVCGGADNCNRYFHPRLSGVDFGTKEFGKQGAKAMIDHLQNGKALHKLDIIPNVTIIRGESLKNLK